MMLNSIVTTCARQSNHYFVAVTEAQESTLCSIDETRKI